MTYKNIPKYSLAIIFLIALYNWVLPNYLLIRAGGRFFFDTRMISIIVVAYLAFFVTKTDIFFNLKLKKVLVIGLLYGLIVGPIGDFSYLLNDLIFFRRMEFESYYMYQVICTILFTFCSIILISKIRKTKYSFKELLICLICFAIVCNVFHYIYIIITSLFDSNDGMVGVGAHSLLPFYTPFISYFSFKNMNLGSFLFFMISSPAISLLFVIYFYSSYVLFLNYNKKGLYSLIPIKKDLVFLKISKKPTWWIIFLLIPFVRIIPKYFINLELAKQHNKEASYALGMTLIPWFFYGKLILNTKTTE
ncbi:DUF5684 domain-containing protein [Cellulophaga fucicola]|uniref:Uncharacterized protein n=1 Tax=Cellulophaga fucicola TaxID=76595 RepID=A0A1K1QJT0_9FLAO|nr:DUF5684 domain-containing protein [Cellulophaga fucicola]SFW60029.1 hypothetical protein SAMN05660313_02699 [Cellulophaga fucicola]